VVEERLCPAATPSEAMQMVEAGSCSGPMLGEHESQASQVRDGRRRRRRRNENFWALRQQKAAVKIPIASRAPVRQQKAAVKLPIASTVQALTSPSGTCPASLRCAQGSSCAMFAKSCASSDSRKWQCMPTEQWSWVGCVKLRYRWGQMFWMKSTSGDLYWATLIAGYHKCYGSNGCKLEKTCAEPGDTGREPPARTSTDTRSIPMSGTWRVFKLHVKPGVCIDKCKGFRDAVRKYQQDAAVTKNTNQCYVYQEMSVGMGCPSAPHVCK